jgi:hypothetical protein
VWPAAIVDLAGRAAVVRIAGREARISVAADRSPDAPRWPGGTLREAFFPAVQNYGSGDSRSPGLAVIS